MSDIHGVRGKRRRKRNKNRYTAIMIVLIAVLAAAIGLLLFFLLRSPKTDTEETFPSIIRTGEGDTIPEESETGIGTFDDVLKEARRLAGSYDYDAAIAYVQNSAPAYESVPELAAFVSECRANKTLLVKWADNSQISHIFFHTLVADADTAFASFKRYDYNEVMTTLEEYNAIIESLYAHGYVLVHLSDIAKVEKQPDGTEKMVWQPIYLPAGKTPIVLSVDDVSYYEYMNNTGFATRLVIDENGRIVNEMDIYQEAVPKQTDGRTGGPLLATDENGAPLVDHTLRGDFDVVPLLDRFVEAHPDFSYHGAKGTIALTGYNGVLGYRTSEITYGSKDPAKVDLTIYEKWPKTYMYENVHIEEDRVKAKEVADAMKAEGWKFASHTWGHMRMEDVVDKSTGSINGERFTRDTSWWEAEVKPIIGDTDIIIFAFGSDIGSWRGYSETNDAYRYLKNHGFSYFCNVDGSTLAWVQMKSSVNGDSGYLRQGRVNLDGTFMLKQLINLQNTDPKTDSEKQKVALAKEVNEKWFNVKDVFDRRRPLTKDPNGRVAGLTIPEGLDLNSLLK